MPLRYAQTGAVLRRLATPRFFSTSSARALPTHHEDHHRLHAAKNHYEVLGLHYDATPEEIKKSVALPINPLSSLGVNSPPDPFTLSPSVTTPTYTRTIRMPPSASCSSVKRMQSSATWRNARAMTATSCGAIPTPRTHTVTGRAQATTARARPAAVRHLG